MLPSLSVQWSHILSRRLHGHATAFPSGMESQPSPAPSAKTDSVSFHDTGDVWKYKNGSVAGQRMNDCTYIGCCISERMLRTIGGFSCTFTLFSLQRVGFYARSFLSSFRQFNLLSSPVYAFMKEEGSV